MRAVLFACIALLVLGTFSDADAKPRHGAHRHHVSHVRHAHVRRVRHLRARRQGDGRPAAWCGWWMSLHVLGKNVRDLWVARNWARVGQPASGPAPGVIGVQPHHVFKVVQVVGPGRVLAISGNDGHAVRTRVRSTSRVIAWRSV